MKIINNNPEAYPEKRNITLFGKDSIKYIEDFFCYANKLKHKLTGKGNNLFYKGFFYSITDQKTPCHFFNCINLGKNSWVVTFETTLPRLGLASGFWYKRGVKQLVKPNCKKIIALSQCSFDRQVDYLQKNFPHLLNSIKEKMVVMHPPQKMLIQSYEEKKISNKEVVFTIVGSDFFRKGGREVLSAFEALIPHFPNLKLNIISDLVYGDYASKTTIEDYHFAKKTIEDHHKNIFCYNGLSNSRVLEILQKSHVGLLPSWGDTYGYSVIEAQSAGCPVITTNIRAFPEINNNAIGWIIDVPLNQDKDADVDTLEKRAKFRTVLENGLVKIISDIMNGTSSIKEKGCLALERIKNDHSPEVHKAKLIDIYNKHFKS